LARGNDLAAEPEPGGNGSLLDNTLVPYVSEVAERNGTWTCMPFLLLGGKNLGLVGDRLWTNDGRGQRFTNDLWMAIAEASRCRHNHQTLILHQKLDLVVQSNLIDDRLRQAYPPRVADAY
jgi:hypothetical protein